MQKRLDRLWNVMTTRQNFYILPWFVTQQNTGCPRHFVTFLIANLQFMTGDPSLLKLSGNVLARLCVAARRKDQGKLT